MGHKESKIFEKVEEGIANQNESNSKSLEKKVLQLWKSLAKNQDYLEQEQVEEFFSKVYDYCKTILKHEGIIFDPSLSREDLIESWRNSFGATDQKEGRITFEGFCLALKAVASACNKDLREREIKEIERPVVTDSVKTDTVTKSAVEEVHEAEQKLLSELHTTKEKMKEKEKEKEKEKKAEHMTPNSLRKVFGHNENPILNQTFIFQFFFSKRN